MAYNLRILPMQKWNGFPRIALILTLFIALCAGMASPYPDVAEAKPLVAADELNVFISEFRVRGPNGADDEFVEIYNASGAAVTLTNWSIKKSSGCGTTPADLVASFTTTLAPGQYYLFAKSGSYSGATTADLLYSTAGVSDDGGIALVNGSGVIIDQVGLCSTTLYKEGSTLSSMSGTANQSYERKSGGSAGSCKDTDNNAADFILNASTSNPQNFSNAAIPCLAVIKATSSVYSSPNPPTVYSDTSSAVIDIQLTFSNIVTVTGSPTLLMETGATDHPAVFAGGSGTNILTFNYTVQPGDNTNDLDYVSVNALSLNGGTITGASGDATLILPKPGSPGVPDVSGSLSVSEEIRIDNTSVTPTLLSFSRQNPTSQYTTADNDELVFRITFSEAVTNVDTNDFDVITNPAFTPTVSITNVENGRMYDLKVTNTGLDTYNGMVSINLRSGYSISDVNDLPLLTLVEPTTDEFYSVDNTPPTITFIRQTASQSDPTNVLPISFDVVFDNAIDVSTFTTSDIKQNGTATGITWTLTNPSNDKQNFILSVTATSAGTIIPSIDANRIKDLAGNDNAAHLPGNCALPEPNNCVTFNDAIAPTVTVDQSGTQPDPTGALPINFTVQFTEPINTATFTTADITQSGTASSVVWSITNSGDNTTFTLSATSSGYGTIKPSIAANRVTDLSGNNNTASTSTDNTVTYALISNAVRSVIINEVAWPGTTSGLTDDEWIELYNPGSSTMNISGWRLKATDGDPDILIPNGKTIPAGGFYLLERDNDNTVSDIAADQIYSGALSNSGEILTLYDPTNKVIDTANGNGGSWPAGSSSTYGTMERRSGTTDSDIAWATNTGVKKNGKNADGGDILGTPKSSNTPAASVTPVKTSTPFPTSTPIPAAVVIDPRPIINEILPRPGFDWNQDGRVDVFDEFIEIKNLTAIDINLSGWVLDDEKDAGSDPYTIPSITLKPGQRVVFYGLETNILLSDGGDTVRLIHPTNGKIYDAYTYSIAKNEDLSICRLPDGNVFGGWYDDCIPTPNLTNTREGVVPSMPGGGYESPVCELPDTLSEEFLFAECHGYGANIWNAFYWDESGWLGTWIIPQNLSKWETFIK